jgi:hypothetical protein
MQQNDKNGNAQTFGWPLAVSTGLSDFDCFSKERHFHAKLKSRSECMYFGSNFEKFLVTIQSNYGLNSSSHEMLYS